MCDGETTSDLERLRQCYALRLPVSNSFINIREVYDVVTQKVPSQRIAAFFLDEGGDCYQIFLADVEAYCFLLKEGIVLFGDHLKPHPSIVSFNVYCRFPSVTNKNLIDLFNTYGPVLQVCHIKDPSIPFDHAFSAKRRLMFYLNAQQTEIDLPQVIKAQFNEYNVMLKIIKFCMACMKENHDAANCDKLFNESNAEMHEVNSSKIEEDILEQVVSTMNDDEYDSPNSDDIMEDIVKQLESDGNETPTSTKDMSDEVNDDFMQDIVNQMESDDNESQTSTKNVSDEVNEDFIQESEELMSETDGQKQVSSSRNKKNKRSAKNDDSDKNYSVNLRQRPSPENPYTESKLRKRRTRTVLFDGPSSESDSETNVHENKTEKKPAYARKILKSKTKIKEEDENSEKTAVQSVNNQLENEPLDKGCEEASSNNVLNERTRVIPEQNSDSSSRTTPNKHDIPVRKRKRLPSLSDLDDKSDPVSVKSTQSTAKTNLSDILSFKDLKMPADMKSSKLDLETFRKFLIGTEGIDDLTIHMFQHRAFKEQIKEQMEALCDALDKDNAIDCAFRTKIMNLKKMIYFSGVPVDRMEKLTTSQREKRRGKVRKCRHL